MSGAKRIAVVGISGRMGQEIATLASELGFQVTAGVSPSGKTERSGAQVVTDVAKLEPSSIDVVIDFSLPKATSAVAAWCAKNKKPLVSGVTGLSDADKKHLEEAAHRVAVFWAPNMSLGVAVMARLIAELGRHLSQAGGFDFQIEELHHNRKKDRPSGTAIYLQERLKTAVQPQAVPEALSIRGGGIFGIHKLWAMSEEETLTIEHTAMNRRVFARGALRAASWILGKAPALYAMDDLLGT